MMVEQRLEKQNEQNINNLTSGNGTIPSDTLISDIYQKSLYTPEEQQALQGQYQNQSDIAAAQLAENRQIQQLQQD